MKKPKLYLLITLAVAIGVGVWALIYTSVRNVEKEWRDGSTYTGEWWRGMKHGWGEWRMADGSSFRGEFVCDTIHGRGRFIYADGSIYRGDWQKGLRHGYGSLCHPDSASVFDGQWQADSLIYGSWTTDSSRYEGALRNYIPHGVGIIRHSNHKVYAGRWNHGKRHGVGRLQNDSTRSFEFGYWNTDSLCKPEGMKYKYGDKVFGIDVSHHQKHITWGDLTLYCDRKGEVFGTGAEDTTYLQPVWFVFMKSTEGATYQDPQYRRNVKMAQTYGLIKGSYHYMRTTSTIPDQVNNYIRNTVWEPGDFPPVLDVEIDPEKVRNEIGVERLKEMCLEWLEAIEAYYGVRPIVYTYTLYRREFLMDKRFKKYDFWIARYVRHGDRRPKRPDDWIVWQFTDSGRVGGIKPIADLNVWDGNIEKLEKYLSTR